MPKKPTRKLKTYQTSLGFYDQAVAAPSMKAALEAWGASSNLFHQGAAKETDDPDIVAATMASPGVVLRRPVGSDGPFTEHAALPTDLGDGDAKPKRIAVGIAHAGLLRRSRCRIAGSAPFIGAFRADPEIAILIGVLRIAVRTFRGVVGQKPDSPCWRGAP